MVTTSSQQGQGHQLNNRQTMLVQQWLRQLRINDGNNAIVMRATIIIMTTAKMPVR
jgi:hypothetical protein